MKIKNAPPAPESGTPLSRWEWLPPAALLILLPLYFLSAPGGTANRLAFFLGLGLLPGTVWRLAGGCSWKIHRIFFAGSLVAFVMDNPVLRPDADTWRMMLANWRPMLLGFAVSFIQPLWGMFRSHRLLVDSGVRISHLDSLKLFLSGCFFSIFLPGSTGGDTYRVYAITHGYKKKLAPAITSITLDRLLGLPSLILIVVAGMALDYDFFLSNPILANTIPLISGLGAVSLAFVAYLALAGKVRRRADWAKPEAGGRPLGWLRRTHLMIATNVKRPATLPLTLFYGLLSNLTGIVACQCFAAGLGVTGVPALRYYVIIPLVMTINSIPGAPGGVGQGELAMATFLEMAGSGGNNAQAGIMVMLLFRLSNMAVGLAGGLLYVIGKMDFSGIDHESQGLTQLISKNIPKLVIVNMSYARVLVVDDIATNIDVAKGILKPYGIKIDRATSGRQAIEMIRAENPRYSAVFMDYMMPEMNGIETTRIIREEIGTDYARNIPIIALTASAAAGNEEMFLHQGFQAFVAKPTDMMKLDSILRTLVRNKNLEEGNPDAGENAAPSGRREGGAGGAAPSLLAGTTIGGLNKKRGVERFGGDETAFIDVLRSYAVNTPPLLDKLRTYLAAENFKDYAIVVHGIKGSSYGIFAQEVGMAAETLETAVKAGDFSAAKTRHAAFEKSAEALLNDIGKALVVADSVVESRKPAAPAPDPGLLRELRDACGMFDMDRIDAAMAGLESFRYENGGELVLWLRNRVTSMAFEEIAGGAWPAGR